MEVAAQTWEAVDVTMKHSLQHHLHIVPNTRFPNHIRVAHACPSAFRNIIYYSVPDVTKRERVGSQVDQVVTYCVLLVLLLNLPRASIFVSFSFSLF